MTRWIIISLLSLIITVTHVLLFYSSWGDRIEPLAMDVWYQVRGSLEPPDGALLIAMDEQSYGVLDIPLNQAWPRSQHVKLLKRLAEVGAKRVIFDVLFLGESRSKETDKELAKAFALLPTVLGADSIVRDHSSASGSFKLEEVLLPYEPFLNAAETPALVGFPEDYGYLRRFLSKRSSLTKDFRTLSEAAAEIDRKTSVLPSERDFVKFYGPRGTIPTYSYYQVIDPDKPLPEALLKNKIVFVGLVLQTDLGPAQKDIFLTPYGRIFGTEIHVTSTLNLLNQDWIVRLPKWAEALILGSITLLISLALLALRPQWGVLLLVGAIIVWVVASYLCFINDLFIPGTIMTTVIFPVTFLASTLYFYFVTRKAQLKMESAFQLYVSPEMAKSIAQNSKKLGLGGEKVWATALFTDIAGFTSITEDMPAEQVSAMLNAYFTEVMDVVFENQGTLIKFIGDAVFVIWGAPIQINDHALKACETAIAIDREVARFNASKRFPPLHTRIGVHTGPMVVGNLGSEKRFDYTAIGDSVNLASRVEGINKYFGTTILITDSVKKEIGGAIATLPAGAITVVGKKEVVELYMLFSSQPPKSVAENWGAGLEAFKDREWEKALQLLKDAAENFGILLKPLELYKAQIEQFSSEPPDEDWQGEIVFSKK
ncbi:MAG: adenylate/guanylate cyclase domain-containing protein [Deltaproteobacteria bacterium]|nr:adenylate/guanylate cyclase domain-containing protein [Deltaproteobacteria bacterium]